MTSTPQHVPRALYHTPSGVADALFDLVDAEPSSILDLASGAGGLWERAVARWPGAVLTTVDEDPAAKVPPPPHAHHVADALSWDPGGPAAHDLVTCNPPFMRSGRYAGRNGRGVPRGVEADFARRCLSLARDGGTVAMVLPDGLVTGRLSGRFRADLVAEHDLAHVAELPAGSFRGTEARAYLVVARARSGPTRAVSLRDAGGRTLAVDAAGATRRMDHRFHSVVPVRGTTLADLGARVTRGGIPRSAAAARGIPVFHVRDFPAGDGPYVGDPAGPGAGAEAAPGDILVARLGRNAHAQVCGLEGGHATLTDAVFGVRVPVRWRDRALAALVSPEGRERLAATARGVGMRMLAQADLATMPLPGEWTDVPARVQGT